MSYADFYAIMEAVWTVLALVGIGLSIYLLRAERHDRALAITENGRAGILSWALVLNETLRVGGQLLLFVVGVLALATPNPNAPATPLGPALILLIVLFAAIGVAQSIVLVYTRVRIARYPIEVVVLAKEETLLAVQHDVEQVGVRVGEAKEAATAAYVAANDVQSRISALTNRANRADDRADISEKRADAAEEREG